MYVCMYICMFFHIYLTIYSASDSNDRSPLNATLLRNEFSWVRYPTRVARENSKKVNEDP